MLLPLTQHTLTNIAQIDGNVSLGESLASNYSESNIDLEKTVSSDMDTEIPEAFEIITPTVFVNSGNNLEPSLQSYSPSLPLCLTLNARSVLNKILNLKEL